MGRDEFEEIPLYPSAVEHTRADLKIQEGCNNFCAYCIIPYTRGSLKSRQPDAVIEEAKRLSAAGFKEIVFDRYPFRGLRHGFARQAYTGTRT